MARLSAEPPFVHPDCEITESRFGGWVEIGRGSRIHRSARACHAVASHPNGREGRQ